jgi:flagellar biosynthesis protein FliQ
MIIASGKGININTLTFVSKIIVAFLTSQISAPKKQWLFPHNFYNSLSVKIN